jgi:RNA 2',3'-cyclic 3'-phosphodiesterase
MTPATPKQRRLFYALWPDDITRSALARLQFELHGNKTRYRNFHITLAFLGDQPETMLPELQTILSGLDGSEMNLELNRIGYFTRQRIAWAGMSQEPPALKQLQTHLTAQLSEHHVRFESRALFRPHITLVRDADAPAIVEFPPIIWHAKQVTLMQSVTIEDGLEYKVLASHWLQRAR